MGEKKLISRVLLYIWTADQYGRITDSKRLAEVSNLEVPFATTSD